MVKAVLKFDLADAFQKTEFAYCSKAEDLVRVIHEYQAWLRGEQKYSDRETVTITEARNKLTEMLRDFGLEGLV
jgi:hypothetical protein